MEPVIKCFIERLNRENGGASFEGIASILAEKEICSNIMAYYEESLIQAKQLLTIFGVLKENQLTLWREHIVKNKNIPLYPISKVTRIVTALAIIYEGTAEYEELYNLIEEILINRNEKFEAAQLRKDRAMNLFNAGMYEKAIRHFSIVKIQWYDHETLRGCLLTAWILNECYTKLELHSAALQELFSILHMTTLDEDTLSNHKDLFVQSLAIVYMKYLRLGMFGSAIIMGKLTLFAIIKYNKEPHIGDGKVTFHDTFDRNTILSLITLKNKYNDYADKLLPLVEKVNPRIVITYKMLFIETDEEFEQGWDEAKEKLEDAKKFREEIKAGKYSNLKNDDIEEPINEGQKNQERKFTYKDMLSSIEFTNSFDAKRISEHIFAYLQTIFVFFLDDKDLTWIENQLRIKIVFDDKLSKFQIRELPNNEVVEFELALNPKIIDELFNTPFTLLFELEQALFFYILMQCTIDKQEEIKLFLDRLKEKDFFEGLSGRVPYGFTMNTFFIKEDYVELLK